MSGTAEDGNLAIAERWCSSKGSDWKVVDTAGRGGTAPVFTLSSPEGLLALKLLDKEFSEGERGEETARRVQIQKVRIGRHDCPHLVQILDGGRFEDRLFLLMNKAEGTELAKSLHLVPREKIRAIIDQIARAVLFLRERNLCHRDIKSSNVFVSDDFSRSTLLDVSVARDVYDPIGLGTDEGGPFPVVATSRYSPPEYLFRLIPAGFELWNALDIYQLGGLIHDLVSREEMFEQEYQESKTNKYRFAYIVSTQTPSLTATDVDPALLLLGRRALDKDWRRRSTIRVEDFLDTKDSRTRLGLSQLGFKRGGEQAEAAAARPNVRQIVSDLAKKLEDDILAYFKESEILATHKAAVGAEDNEWNVVLEWSRVVESGERSTFTLRYALKGEQVDSDFTVQLRCSLESRDKGGEGRKVELDVPPAALTSELSEWVFSSAVGALDELASALLSERGE